MMDTKERLLDIYPFDERVIERVAEVAVKQSSFTSYGEMLEYQNIKTLPGKRLVDVQPADYDESQAVIYHMPMANPLDTNQLFQIASLSMMLPERRIIALANPSGIAWGHGVLTRKERARVKYGDFKPVTDKTAKYIEDQGIEQVDQIGCSYGVDLAMAYTFSSYRHDTAPVRNQLLVEPATVVAKSLIKLATDFKKSEATLDDYVENNDLEIFRQARKDGISNTNNALGLLRPTNIAIAKGLSKGLFTYYLGLARDLAANTSVAWGSESELGDDDTLREIVKKDDSIQGYRLEGHKHALINDLHLIGALAISSLDN